MDTCVQVEEAEEQSFPSLPTGSMVFKSPIKTAFKLLFFLRSLRLSSG